MENQEKKQPEFFCSYSSRLTNFLKAFGLSYETREMNEITGRPFCVFKRTPKLVAIVEFWQECRNRFKDYDENGEHIDREGGDV